MCDYIPKPTVKTTIRIGGFTLFAFAYRALTPAECRLAVNMYRQQFKVKSFLRPALRRLLRISAQIQQTIYKMLNICFAVQGYSRTFTHRHYCYCSRFTPAFYRVAEK